MGIFGIGQIPLARKTVRTARRASIGVLQILLQRGLDVDLRDVIAAAHSNFFCVAQNADVKKSAGLHH